MFELLPNAMNTETFTEQNFKLIGDSFRKTIHNLKPEHGVYKINHFGGLDNFWEVRRELPGTVMG